MNVRCFARFAIVLALLTPWAPLPARDLAGRVAADLAPVIELAADGSHPTIATSPEGNTLIAWLADGIATRRLRANGDLGATVDLHATNRSLGALRAGAGASGFVLAWREIDDEGARVFTQRVRPNGAAAAGGPREIARPLFDPTVALGVAPDGRYAVLFTDARPIGENGEQGASVLVRLARFDAGGRRIGSILRLAGGERPIEEQTRIAAGVAAGNGFVLAGSTAFSGCDGEGTEEIRSAVALVPWQSTHPQSTTAFADGRDCAGGPVLIGLLPSRIGALAVLAGHNQNLQRFDPATGAPHGPRKVFAELPTPACEGGACTTLAAVAGDGRGRFVAVWEKQHGEEYNVAVQLRGREGGAQTELIPINDAPSLRPTNPAVTMTDNGMVRIVWEQADDADFDVPAAIHLRLVKFN